MSGQEEYLSPADLWDAGWSWGFDGTAVGQMLETCTRELGPLLDWQRDALCGGHAVGVRERAEYERDRAAMDKCQDPAPDTSDVPF